MSIKRKHTTLDNISYLQFKVTGIFYKDEEVIEKVTQTMKKGDILTLERDPHNLYDYHAVRVFFNDLEIGYVERDRTKNAIVSKVIAQENHLECRVDRTVFNNGKCPIVYGTFSYTDTYNNTQWDKYLYHANKLDAISKDNANEMWIERKSLCNRIKSLIEEREKMSLEMKELKAELQLLQNR